MRNYGIVLTVVLVAVLTAGTVFAQPSAKSTVASSKANLLSTEENVWTPILDSAIHTSEQKDLNIDVSLECGLLTRTNVRSSKGVKDQAAAEAGVAVRVVVDKGTSDERIAEPGDVTFCRRSQELTATFGGIMDQCIDQNGDGTITMEECTWTDEELQLILQTMNANAFNYVLDDLGAGDHTLTVEAMIDTCAGKLEEGPDGKYTCVGDETVDAEGKAWIGKGSMAVDEIRLVKGEDIVIP